MAVTLETTHGVPAAEPPEGVIAIRGARVHNLQNVDLDLPRDRLIVVTGPSGSGKSSLAFDTLFAEGQRQYIESLSPYARQFLHQMERADVDLIDGLQPTISIDQRAGSVNPRSTVATVTEIYDYLRLLYARAGQPACYQCGATILQQAPEQIIAELAALPPGTKLVIMAPLVRGRKGGHQEALERIRKAGFVRARVDGEIVDLDHLEPLSPKKSHTIEAVIDRIVVREGIDTRLAESTRLALSHGEGTVLAIHLDPPAEGAAKPPNGTWHEKLYSTLFACPNCKISLEELEPRTFSFNSPYGACPGCQGLGVRDQFDPERVIADVGLTLTGGAIAPWKGNGPPRRQQAAYKAFLKKSGVDGDAPLAELPSKSRQQLLYGDGKSFLGVLAMLEQEYVSTLEPKRRQQLAVFRGHVVCQECGGSRLRAVARACRFGGLAIHELSAMNIGAAAAWIAALELPPDKQPIASPLLAEVGKRLDFLKQVGVDYLTLDRPADTLSGGEMQRVRLATGIGSGLVGVCYVLDEPSIGLHPRDNERLIDALVRLQQQGNTVLVVEHDAAIMRRADYLVDMGPGAGTHGGRIVSQGTPGQVASDPSSITGQYLSGALAIEVPPQRRKAVKSRSLVIEGVTTNNLKDVEVRIPLSLFVCVTGVSGSGKSSLINETLAPAVAQRLGSIAGKPGPFRSLRGVNQIDKLIEIDQTPIGRTPRSNPATYCGVFDEIRRVFASTREARQRGFKSGRFSFNVKGGRCEECQGQGIRKIEMNFLADLVVTCPVCEGKRFNEQTLSVRYRGLSIADVLALSIDDAAEFFESFPQIVRLLGSLQEVGLGYLSLGQSSTTLSGGESQRVKLAAELARVETGNTLYILDEPTTGLHFDDVKRLLGVLNRLVDLGNTVLVIEHNVDVIKTADWIIDLGPEGGQAGGYVTATGTPEEVAAVAGNHTGEFAKRQLQHE